MKKNLFKFIFIVSRHPSEIFDVIIYGESEERATFKLHTIIQGDFKSKIRSVEQL